LKLVFATICGKEGREIREPFFRRPLAISASDMAALISPRPFRHHASTKLNFKEWTVKFFTAFDPVQLLDEGTLLYVWVNRRLNGWRNKDLWLDNYPFSGRAARYRRGTSHIQLSPLPGYIPPLEM
jgi:hypothetical protein